MELRQAVLEAIKTNKTASEVEEDSIGELVVAEYIVFLLALDTYIRYLEEATGKEDASDEVVEKGIRLLRGADAQLDTIKGFLDEQLPSATHKKMLAKYLAIRAASPAGVGRRAIGLRTLLSRGGASTMRAVFETNRAIRAVREAISASMVDNADAALDLFVKITFRNTRLHGWIKLAADTAVSEPAPANVIEAGSKEAQDQKPNLLAHGIEQLAASGADESKKAQEAQTETILQVQAEATEAAKVAMAQAGEPDEPPTKSEVVGMAVAAATAAMSDPSNPQNVPEPLRHLDDEQRTAALSDGRVLVAAGAGAGKSTTLVSRVTHLIKDRRVLPSRILATSFNTKAASELKEKIGRSVGGDSLQQMSVGTMHSLFRRFIGEYGTPAERTAMGLTRGGGNGFIQGGGSVARTVQKMWAECFPPKERPTPKLKNMLRYKSQWSGNNITPEQARSKARKREELDAADWYELYEGLKGAIPGWTPPCEVKAKRAVDDEYQEKYDAWRRRGGRGEPPKKRGTTFETFMTKQRPGNERLGDFDDMLSIFREVLKREPGVRSTIQKMYDHVMVDECQDLNQVQHDIIEMMSEHITDGADGKSLWMVGDDKQSIYGFRGARPDLFTGLHGKEGWKTRMIKTNYRCEPEIVDAANKLIAHNSGQIPMEARPSPAKVRGTGNIKVETPHDEAEAALGVAEEIKTSIEAGSNVSDFSVLCRTNAEIHAYETACIIRGIPYARKGAASFLGSPETKAFLSYVQLATGDDFAKMQKSLTEVINRPNRFFLSPDAASQAVEESLSEFSRKTGQTLKNVNPVSALRDRDFVAILASKIAKTRSGFKYDKTVEQLEDLSSSIDSMQANSGQPGYTTKDLFEEILALRGTGSAVDPLTGRSVFVSQTFRETLQTDLRDAAGDEDDAADEEEEDSSKGLGNISFLFKLAEVDPTDPMDIEQTPGKPDGFKAKMERYAAKARDLRIDITKWDKEQQALPPEKRSPPPGVYLGTIHCSPADEPVLTTDGWVSIGDLDPNRHRLASYAPSCNQLFWGRSKGAHEGPDGYGFQKGSRFYKGPLLTLLTQASKTRVTPDHKIRVKWAETFHNKYVVYLMRRGEWWRVGHCKSAPRPYKAGDLGSRLATEKADAGWILKVCDTKEEAILEEGRLQGFYGIPGVTFEASKQRTVTSQQLHKLHESVKHAVGPRAEAALAEFGLSKEYPLYVGGPDRECDKRESFTIQARNCLSGYMLLPAASKTFVEGTGPREVWTKPEWHLATVTSAPFEGDVFSLVVFPHHFYVSGGAIVHNSVKGAQWPTTFVQMPKGKFPIEPKPKPGEPPPDPEEVKEQLEGERRLAYVALTRAAKALHVICPTSVGGKAAGVSPFVDEAELSLGENVIKAGTPEAAVAEAKPGVIGEAEAIPKEATVDEGPDEWDTMKVLPWSSGV